MKINQLMAIKWQRREQILVGGAIIAISIVFFRLGYGTMSASSSAQKIVVANLKNEIAANETVLNDLNQRKPATLTRKSGQAIFQRYIAANSNFSTLFEELIGRDPKNKFFVKRIDVLSQEQTNGFKKTLLKMEVEGSFFSIGELLESLEKTPLLTEVKSIKIERIEEDMKKCQASIELYSYVSRS